MERDFRGRVKPVPKKKRLSASNTQSQRQSEQSGILNTAVETPDAEAHPPAVATETQGELPEQAGPSSLSTKRKEVALRRSTRPRRTHEVQVLDERVFME